MPFIDSQQNQYESLNETICPIGELLYENKWQLSGTGFYISKVGIGLTATHNLVERVVVGPLESQGREDIFAFFRQIPKPENKVTIEVAQIKKAVFLRGIDVAIIQTTLSAPVPYLLNMAGKVPAIGERVYCYSFPTDPLNRDNINGKLALNVKEFEGVVTELYLQGRDRTLLPGPCIEAIMKAEGGTSGGPVFNERGHVFGIISTSLSGDPPITYVTPIFPILDTSFEIDTNLGIKAYSLRELSKMGRVSLKE